MKREEKIIIRNIIKNDLKDMTNYHFYESIKSAVKYKSLCKTSFVAVIENKVVGVIISEKSLLGSYYVQIIEVSNQHRKKGIGTTLLKKLENAIKESFILFAYLPSDESTVEFYKSNNFILGDNVLVAIKPLEKHSNPYL